MTELEKKKVKKFTIDWFVMFGFINSLWAIPYFGYHIFVWVGLSPVVGFPLGVGAVIATCFACDQVGNQ